ncbi:MAG: tRNA (N(6)-L-threonylcarbamoyladenosine(37)-C(2))-methylthiotransferase MtaB [Firmicutes bacterium]|nr:tRNA (N(6)-L-threonylcarbamoyladenosine(37)-C(2))-methylthiotransferase MtaB [Bacillota bacterium]
MKIAAVTLGCKVNQCDAGETLRLFARRGWEIVPPGPEADAILVNTCDVTNASGKKSRRAIRRAAGLGGAAVVVCGCCTRTAPGAAAGFEGADLVVSSMDSAEIVARVEEYLKESGRRTFGGPGDDYGGEPAEAGRAPAVSGEPTPKAAPAVSGELIPKASPAVSGEPMPKAGRTRYFLKIEDGCDMFCSYCVIPYARGKVRSRPPEEILSEAKAAVTNSYREIVLTGIHIASYGKDLYGKNTGLPALMREISGLPGLARVRLGSVEPRAVTADFLEAAASPVICGHFHLSLQSGCDAVLKAMNRKYTAEEYASAAKRLREAKPEAHLTTDVIAGFPGETDGDFDETCRFVEKIGFLKIHAFPFSAKSGTAAASLPGRVPENVIAARVKRLIRASEKMSADIYRSAVGKTVEVLFEEESGGYVWGHTHNYLRVGVRYIKGSDLINRTLPARLLEAGADSAAGELITRQ